MPATEEILATDMDAQDIIILNLERATQCCVDIAAHIISRSAFSAPNTMVDAFATLLQAGIISSQTCARMQKAVGLRNILVHQYRQLNWSIVWIILQNHLTDYVDFTAEVRGAAQDAFKPVP
jgi:uncharacterized protein YutE (UPF0331/DUF86 family)